MDKAQDEICEWVEIYALGGLDEEERLQFEQHLSDCADCREQLKELVKVIDVLPLAAFEVVPPEGMKSRVLGRVLKGAADAGVTREDNGKAEKSRNAESSRNTESSRNAEASRMVASSASPTAPLDSDKPTSIPINRNTRLRNLCAVLAAAAAVLLMYTVVLHQDVRELRQELAQLDSPSQGLKVNEVVVLDPAAEDIVARGLATIVIDAKGTHLLVQAESLPELKGSEAFQVWLIKGDVKQSAGTFLTSQGTGAMYYTFDPQDYDTVAITLEPDGQGEQPRGRVILAAELEG